MSILEGFYEFRIWWLLIILVWFVNMTVILWVDDIFNRQRPGYLNVSFTRGQNDDDDRH